MAKRKILVTILRMVTGMLDFIVISTSGTTVWIQEVEQCMEQLPRNLEHYRA